MIAPFVDGGLSRVAGLAAAAGLGIVFGWFLERGGMGHAPRLAAQFTGRDWSVLRVMFSAILTATLGLYWLARLDLLDLSRVYVQPTYVLPQVVGGIIFGVGFATAGLCPGTACVSAATGRLDGAAVVLGLLAGVFGFHAAYPVLGAFVERTATGPITLPTVLHLPYGVVVLGLVGLALLSFAVAGRIEQWRSGPLIG